MKRTITHRGMLAMSLAGLLLPWALPGKADAAITLGQVSPVVNPSLCSDGNFLQAVTATVPYEVPSPGGVITSWSHRGRSGSGGSGRLQIWRDVPGLLNFSLVGTTVVEDFNAAGLVDSFPTRLQVSTGDELGLRAAEDVAVGCIYGGISGDDVYANLGGEPSFGGETDFSPLVGDYLVNVSAVLEPDADGDGFGDETQDDCPTDASTQGACPPEDGTTPPVDGVLPSNEFSFGKVKKNKRKGTAKLTVKNLPGPGELELAKNKKVKGKEKTADASKEKLPIKPKGKAKKKLNRTGKTKVKARVTYTPDGGSPNTENKKIKLVKR